MSTSCDFKKIIENIFNEALKANGIDSREINLTLGTEEDFDAGYGDEFTYKIINCALTGERMTGLKRDKKMTEDNWSFAWIIPKDTSRFQGIADGNIWTAPLSLIKKTIKEPKGQKGLGEQSKEQGKPKFDLDDAPSLPSGDSKDSTVLVSAYWYRVRGKINSFLRNTNERIKKGKKKKTDGVDFTLLTVAELVTFEAGLNELSSAPRYNFFTREDRHNTNPLRRIENKRAVKVRYFGTLDGRIRRPDYSQRFRICPFETPESENIGLDLFLASCASYNAESGTIKKNCDDENGYDFLSLAVGLIPYPNHSDGPRLMMGGKNLKQAEIADGNEPSYVPGYIETQGDNSKINIEDGRFTEALGVNALVALMPYEGFTYEDGIVVSKSFAEKLKISSSKRTMKIRYTAERKEKSFTLTKEEIKAIEEYYKASKDVKYGTFYYGKLLPPFNETKKLSKAKNENNENLAEPLLSAINAIKENMGNSLRYDYRVPGTLEGCFCEILKGRGTKEKIKIEDITFTYNFIMERPLQEGDKLTGRHGNKGVVTKILPDDKMPLITMYGEEKTADVIISPSSVMGRKNLSQIYEMTHSLLLKAKEKGFDFDGMNIQDNRLLSYEEISKLVPMLNKIGTDEKGAFSVSIAGKEEKYRAFAGWQYISRLCHHSKSKMQYRGAGGHVNPVLSEPVSCGCVTGQRLGEMENWSILSYVDGGESENVLYNLRKQDGSTNVDDGKRVHLFEEYMAMAGFPIEEDNGSYKLILKNEFKDYDHNAPQDTRSDKLNFVVGGLSSVKKNCTFAEYDNFKKIIEYACGRNKALILRLFYYCKPLAAEQENVPLVPALYLNYEIIKRHKSIENALRALENDTTEENLEKYQKSILDCIASKEGLLRGHLMGRRLSHSARGVIVPKPDLRIDEVCLPVEMLLGLIQGERNEAFRLEFESQLKLNSKQMRSFSEVLCDTQSNPDSEKNSYAKAANEVLSTCPVWVFAVRQPSLHRHSVQGMKVSCWDKDVIGFPPFATAGFNADFDGDTMAIFLPPEDISKDLSAYSLPYNPGIVGTGSLALADGLDLALGWKGLCRKNEAKRDEHLKKAGLQDKKEHITLSQVLSGMAKHSALPDDFACAVLELQKDICRYSTGAETLTALGFQRAAKAIHCEIGTRDEVLKALKDVKDDSKGLEDKTDKIIKGWIDAPENSPCPELANFVKWKAKGGIKDLRQMTAFLGRQTDFENDELSGVNLEASDYKEKEKGLYIAGNFWEGLTSYEMWSFSYASRSSMCSKKLEVARAGYLSRQLAEGLYNIRVTKDDCGVKDAGLQISWDSDKHALLLAIKFAGKEPDDEYNAYYPVGESDSELEKALSRIAWGRVEILQDKCLKSDDIKKWAAKLKQNEKLMLRSPLTCGFRSAGAVCSCCSGADISNKPYDKATLLPVGANVGLTAAQAIGERGTQLAMKKFHDVGGDGSVAKSNKSKKEYKFKNDTERMQRCFKLLIETILSQQKIGGGADTNYLRRVIFTANPTIEDDVPPSQRKIFTDLPQQLIHFELALSAEGGLSVSAKKSGFPEDARKLKEQPEENEEQIKEHKSLFSAMAYGYVKDCLTAVPDNLQEAVEADDFSALKSRVLFNRKP